MTHALAQTQPKSTAKRITAVLAAAAITSGALLGAASPADAASSTVELRNAVVKLTNSARATKGCKPLKQNSRLTNAAQGHANDMAAKNYFSHTSANGRSWDQRIKKAGWKKPGGENIAYGFDAAGAVVNAWLNSPGHKRNIMDCQFKYIGIGFNADGDYTVQDFGY